MDFENIYKSYWEKVFKFTHNYTNNFHEQEELTQDILYNVFIGLKNFKKKSSLNTFIYSIARNTCIDYINNRKKNKIKVERMAGLHDVAFEENPADFYLKNENIKYFLEVIRALKVENREVFYLSEVENMKYREISLILDIPIGTVKSRLNRAKEMILKRINSNI